MTEALRLIEKHRKNGLLIDSNLFVLLLVGSTNQSRIESFGRTQRYTVDDFRLLRDFVAHFRPVMATPHVLTEVSNLAKLSDPELALLRTKFREIVHDSAEFYEPSNEIMADPLFHKLGLTDAAIARLARQPMLVLTDDLVLWNYLARKGIDAINFTHIRPSLTS